MKEEWFDEVQKIIPRLFPQKTVDYTGTCVKCKKYVVGGKTPCDYNLPRGSETDYVVGTFRPMKG